MTNPTPYNGMPCTYIGGVAWRKSSHSNSQGNCVEFGALPDGSIAVRNSRYPQGPALVYTREEVAALIAGAKDGEFDDLV